MKTESRPEHFGPPSLLGSLLRRLHIDIPLFLALLLAALLSLVILYSAGSQETDILLRQGARMGLAFGLMAVRITSVMLTMPCNQMPLLNSLMIWGQIIRAR